MVKRKAFITERSNELVQVHSKEFDNAELDAQEELEGSILEAASKDQDFYKSAYKNTRDMLRRHVNAFKELNIVEIKNVDVTWR